MMVKAIHPKIGFRNLGVTPDRWLPPPAEVVSALRACIALVAMCGHVWPLQPSSRIFCKIHYRAFASPTAPKNGIGRCTLTLLHHAISGFSAHLLPITGLDSWDQVLEAIIR